MNQSIKFVLKYALSKNVYCYPKTQKKIIPKCIHLHLSRRGAEE